VNSADTSPSLGTLVRGSTKNGSSDEKSLNVVAKPEQQNEYEQLEKEIMQEFESTIIENLELSMDEQFKKLEDLEQRNTLSEFNVSQVAETQSMVGYTKTCERAVSYEDAFKLATTHGLLYIETSALTGLNASVAFKYLFESIYRK